MLRKFPDSAGSPNNSSWSTAMMRVLLDYVDQNKGDNGVFFRDITTGLLGAKQAIERDVPSHLNNDVTVERIRAKLDRFVFDAMPRPPGQTKGLQLPNLWRYGTDALDLLKLPPGIYTDKELEPSREKHRQELAKHREKDASRRLTEAAGSEAGHMMTPESSRREPRTSRRVNGSGLSDAALVSTPDLSRLQAQISTALLKDSPNTKQIQEAMYDLTNNIESAVLQRLGEGGISATQPVALSTELLGRDLQDLVSTLLGCDASMVQYELSKLSAMYAQQRLQMDHFIRALVGAAITLWVLDPVVQGPTDPRYKALVKALKNADATAAAILCAQAAQQYLDQEFKPKIPENARILADKLDHLLTQFLCPPASNPNLIEHAVGFQEPSSRSSSLEVYSLYNEDGESLPGSTITVGGFTAPEWVMQWKKELRDIFERALHLRVVMEMTGGRYEFFFPHPGSKYTISPSTRSSMVSPEPDKYVMLALLPKISGSFQSTAGGSYSEWQVITAAPVSVFNQARHS